MLSLCYAFLNEVSKLLENVESTSSLRVILLPGLFISELLLDDILFVSAFLVEVVVTVARVHLLFFFKTTL